MPVLLLLAERADAAEQAAGRWDRLERERGNLRAAMAWLIESGEGEDATRLAAALWPWWSERGQLGEGRRVLRQVLDMPVEDDLLPAARIQAMVGAAILASDQGAHEEAGQLAAVAVALARERGTPAELILALNTQGRVARERGEYQAAIDSHEEALALARSGGDRRGEGLALSGLGYARAFAGDLTAGAALAEQGVHLLRDAGSGRDLASALIGLGANLSQVGAFPRAEEVTTEALDLFRAIGDTGKVADALWILGLVAQFQRQDARAVALHEENLALRRARGDVQGAAEPMSALAGIALQDGDYSRARDLLDETLAMLEPFDAPWLRSLSLLLRGHVELATGDRVEAAAILARGASLMQEIGNPVYLPWFLEGMAGVAAAGDDWSHATRLIGAREALRANLGVAMPPADPAAFERVMARARDVLGEEAFDRASAAGRAWSLDEAMAAALVRPGGPG